MVLSNIGRSGITNTGNISFMITLSDRSDSKKIKDVFGKSLPIGKVIGVIVDYHIDIIHTLTGKTIGSVDKFNMARGIST